MYQARFNLNNMARHTYFTEGVIGSYKPCWVQLYDK